MFVLNQRAGTPVKPEDYEGIRLYRAPKDIHETRERLKSLGCGVSELEHRDYRQTQFVLTDDGYSHCFDVPTLKIEISRQQRRTANQKTSNSPLITALKPREH